MRLWTRIWASIKLSWYFIRVLPQLVSGAWKIGRLPQPVVSIFGGSQLKATSPYAALAKELAHRLVLNEISVLTGGGPGIMEAASSGALREDVHAVHSIGIGVRDLPDEEIPNKYVKWFVMTDYFSIRKHLLMEYSYAYIIFPGGFGTLDEMGEVMTLMQTGKLLKAPVILMGKEFWKPLEAWIARSVAEGLINPNYAEHFMVTDDLDVVMDTLLAHCARCVEELKLKK